MTAAEAAAATLATATAVRAGGSILEIKDSAGESISLPEFQAIIDHLLHLPRKELVKIFKNTFDPRNLPLLRLNMQILDTTEDRLGVLGD